MVSIISLYTNQDEKKSYNYGIIPTFGSAMLILLDLIEGYIACLQAGDKLMEEHNYQ